MAVWQYGSVAVWQFYRENSHFQKLTRKKGQVDSVEPVELVETVEWLPLIPPVPPVPRNRPRLLGRSIPWNKWNWWNWWNGFHQFHQFHQFHGIVETHQTYEMKYEITVDEWKSKAYKYTQTHTHTHHTHMRSVPPFPPIPQNRLRTYENVLGLFLLCAEF